MSHCQQILDALQDGQWHTSANLYDTVGGYMVLHSRVSDLRKKGHVVEGRHVPGETGAHGYEYRLAPSVTYVEVPRVRREAPSPHEAAAPPAEQLTIPIRIPLSYYDL